MTKRGALIAGLRLVRWRNGMRRGAIADAKRSNGNDKIYIGKVSYGRPAFAWIES